MLWRPGRLRLGSASRAGGGVIFAPAHRTRTWRVRSGPSCPDRGRRLRSSCSTLQRARKPRRRPAGHRALLQRNGTPKERREKHPVGLAGTGRWPLQGGDRQGDQLAELAGLDDRGVRGGGLRADDRRRAEQAHVEHPVPSDRAGARGSALGARSAPATGRCASASTIALTKADRQNTLKEFLVTLYHESRHAEQAFVEVRQLPRLSSRT